MTEIDWAAWARETLRDLTERGVEYGSDYVMADCPACGRHRLQTPDCVCEKCGWALANAFPESTASHSGVNVSTAACGSDAQKAPAGGPDN